MSYEYSEDRLVQKTTAEFMRDELGWDIAFAFDDEVLGEDGTFGRISQREVVLTRYLDGKLREFNPDLPDIAYQEAVKTIVSYSTAQSMVQINRKNYELFLDGVAVTYRDEEDGLERTVRLRVFDFEEPENNHFLAIRELWIQGDISRRRPDILGFVNGIPLLFIELKAVHKNLSVAYRKNLTNYKAYIPTIFHHNAIIMLANGSKGRVGTITSPYGYFNEWKRLKEEEEGKVDFETMLRGMCAKDRFMDIFENFILFDDSYPGQTRKILARNHQYLGVNRAFNSAIDRDVRAGKLGVFWHTQGSGKSYSMIFLARKIHRKLPGDFTFLVLTDRENLDTQIYKRFVGVGAVNENDECRATSGEDLKWLLQGNPRYVFSLIQKFNQDDKTPYTERSNIIVFSDEAHRTQYGLFARRMRHALPNASYLGFTGTPLIGGPDDELTKEVFGDYVSTYDFKRSVEDGSTVPLYYDNRGEKLNITTEAINEQIAEILDDYGLEDEQEARVRRVLSKDYLVITAQDRLDKIAQDFVAHYTTRWQTGKAMLICIDKITTVRMYDLIDKYWKAKIEEQRKRIKHLKFGDEQEETEQREFLQWLEETEYHVVISESSDELWTFTEWGLSIIPHRTIMKSRDLDEEFRKDDHPFRIAIVCAMWLTGFDVESLATLYVDKPMKSHTLMQAIARANRVKEGKANGLIVDYNGILKSLRRALATYASGLPRSKTKGVNPVKPKKELAAAYNRDLQACIAYLASLGYDLQDLIDAEGFDKISEINAAVEAVSLNDNVRAKFEVLALEVFKKAKSLVGEPVLRKQKRKHDAIEAIYKKLKQKDDDDTDIIAVLRELQTAVSDVIEVKSAFAEPGGASGKVFDLSSIDFERLAKEFEKLAQPNTTVQTLKQKVERKLQRMVQQNPTRMDYYNRYQEIIEDYNRETDRATIEKTFEELLKLVESLTEEEQRAAREGLTEEYLAAFDLLREDKELRPAARERIKRISQELIDAVKSEIEKMDHWREKDATKSYVQTFIFDFLWDDKTGLPSDYSQKEVESTAQKVYQHVFRQYPSATENIYAYAA